MPRQIKVRNADGKAKKVEESNALHNRKQSSLGKRGNRKIAGTEAGEQGELLLLLLWDW